MSVSPSSRHGQHARPEPVAAVDVCSILQQDVSNSQVTKPGTQGQKKTPINEPGTDLKENL